MERNLVQLDFSATFDRVSYRGLLYKLRSIGVGGPFLLIVSAAIHSWCLKWHLRLNSKKPKSMVVSRFRPIAPGYGYLTLGGGVLGELKGLRILGITLDSKLTFETHLREVVSKGIQESGSRAPSRKVV